VAVQLLTAPAVAARRAYRDAPLVGLSIVHALLLFFALSIPVVAIGLWWNANTISHNFIHRPFFRSRWASRLFSVWLSLLLGIPQSYWRARHLAHHGEHEKGFRESCNRLRKKTPGVLLEVACVLSLWTALAWWDARLFLTVYAPGYAIGLGLCFLQGHYEHARGTTSHYGWLYNMLFFNDGYHVEHHRHPAAHWSELQRTVRPETPASVWPPVLRWLDALNLDGLEHVVARSPALQRFVLRRHEQAFRQLLPRLGDVRRVLIVGGGLFPRTALILRRLLPDAELTIVDVSSGNLEMARPLLDERTQFVHASYDPARHADADLVVVPLAFRGDRGSVYRVPSARHVVVHDWIWSRRPVSARVSWLLLKRLNLIER
jgi:hypothetical protein